MIPSIFNPTTLDFWVFLGCVAVLLLFQCAVNKKGRRLYPPGPKASWLGWVKLPNSYQWLTYANWQEIYGDLIYVHVFGNPILVLNSARVANDLLDKRSAKYSSRPTRTMVNELMGWDWLFSSMPYGPWWRKHRSLFHRHFPLTATAVYQPLQTKETYAMLRNLAQDPDRFAYHIRRTAAAVVMFISYGHQIAQEGDTYVQLADDALAGLGKAGIFGTYYVDYLPFLKYVPAWFPGASFQRKAREWRKLTRAMLDVPFDHVKRELVIGTAEPCIASVELEKSLQSGTLSEEEEIIKNVSAIGYAGGADTTVSALCSFFLAMTVYPDVQNKARQELDRIVGPSRLPTYEDRPSLPYIECIMWEVLRWNPVTPLGLAHYVTEDDEYNGYFIPKGTTVLPNVWCILHNEATYPDPLRFNPERFSDPQENAKAGTNEIPWPAFGFGRRLCPGRWLAIDQVWLAIACVLSTFDIAKAVDENGHVIEPDLTYTSSQLSRPKPFKCSIRPRSQSAMSLMTELGS